MSNGSPHRFTRREALRILGAAPGVGLVAAGGQPLSAAAGQPPLYRSTRRLSLPKGTVIRTLLKDVPPEALAGGPGCESRRTPPSSYILHLAESLVIEPTPYGARGTSYAFYPSSAGKYLNAETAGQLGFYRDEYVRTTNGWRVRSRRHELNPPVGATPIGPIGAAGGAPTFGACFTSNPCTGTNLKFAGVTFGMSTVGLANVHISVSPFGLTMYTWAGRYANFVVGPNSATTGVPTAAAMCMGPESFVTNAAACRSNVGSSPTSVCPVKSTDGVRINERTRAVSSRSDPPPMKTTGPNPSRPNKSAAWAKYSAGHRFVDQRADTFMATQGCLTVICSRCNNRCTAWRSVSRSRNWNIGTGGGVAPRAAAA